MIEHLLKIFLLAILAIGIASTMWEGNIFERLGNIIEETVGEWWAKPLGQCYICFSFWFAALVCLFMWWPWWYPFATLGMTATISLIAPEK